MKWFTFLLWVIPSVALAQPPCLHRAGRMIILLFLILPLGVVAQPALRGNPTPAGAGGGSVSLIDIDQDGYLDLFSLGADSLGVPHTSVMRYNSILDIFEVTQANFPALKGGDAAWADFDNDGDEDLILSGELASGIAFVEFYEHQAGDSFSVGISHNLPALLRGKMIPGDFDGDGDIDLLMGGYAPSRGEFLSVFQNDGAGGFTEFADTLPAMTDMDIDWMDYDRDGDLDILMQGITIPGMHRSFFIETSLSTGFSRFPSNSILRSETGCQCWLNANGDSQPDLLETGLRGSQVQAKVWQNDQGRFRPLVRTFPELIDCNIQPLDIDQSGQDDLLVIGRHNASLLVSVFTDTGGGYQPYFQFSTGLENGSAQWGDFDNDGDADFVVSGYDAMGLPRTMVFRNTGTSFLYFQ